ncbi:Peptide chain release factor 2 [Anatilimnocola aggregata]|uniref:Peptide chain release factor 2 n=1 Tax=Anatilimnocola aggregata TaxID=2528021 RepID=A0A517YEQ4_9BACT|nr:peptide chain release factor-like protein [Anatilimnocola aggregata]QDU28699.1 Peptide chain release factor 2 [Anatilimnocola aggregata]
MPEPQPTTHPAALSEDELLSACSFQTTRRSGPGGQHRNKVETAVVVTHRPTGVRTEASERRSQAQNKSMAIFRLRLALALSVRQPYPLPTQPSLLWQSRAKGRKLTISDEHADFPALLAEALDCANAHEFDLSAAATQLGVSTTQLVRFLQQSSPAWQWINRERQSRQLRPLK